MFSSLRSVEFGEKFAEPEITVGLAESGSTSRIFVCRYGTWTLNPVRASFAQRASKSGSALGSDGDLKTCLLADHTAWWLSCWSSIAKCNAGPL